MTARIAEDSDFQALKQLVDTMDGWNVELEKPDATVWTRPVEGCNFDMVKIISAFENVTADVLFDVLHDPDYRRIWDSHMLASEEIGIFNVNNDVGYYAMSCPPPLKPRDFVLQRSWLDTGPGGEQLLLSRSVEHKDWPPKKGYIRAQSYITGFVLRPNKRKPGCVLGYVAHCDPQGTLPPWLVNKVTHTLGPRMIKDLKKAALNYETWKNTQPHLRKPWRYPEEITQPRISLEECIDISKTNGVSQLHPQPPTPAPALMQRTRTLPTIPLASSNVTTPNNNEQASNKKKRKFFSKRKLPTPNT